jgi:hypothetical protein
MLTDARKKNPTLVILKPVFDCGNDIFGKVFRNVYSG